MSEKMSSAAAKHVQRKAIVVQGSWLKLFHIWAIRMQTPLFDWCFTLWQLECWIYRYISSRPWTVVKLHW